MAEVAVSWPQVSNSVGALLDYDVLLFSKLGSEGSFSQIGAVVVIGPPFTHLFQGLPGAPIGDPRSFQAKVKAAGTFDGGLQAPFASSIVSILVNPGEAPPPPDPVDLVITA